MSYFADYEWDEAKRIKNLNKHDIDFRTAIRMFVGYVMEEPFYRNEPRWLALGVVDNDVLALVYTIRSGFCRVISARKASRNERKKYHAYVARGGDPPTG